MEIRTLGVVGAGQMGSGIAEVAAVAGLEVVLTDIDDEALGRSVALVARQLGARVEKGRLSAGDREAALGRIRSSARLADHAAAQLVIETAVERFEIKAEIFRQLDATCGPEAILASNTSAIPITRLAALTARPDRVIGMHFMNPAPAMRLIEVVRGLETSDASVHAVTRLAERLGKTPVVCLDHPGFVANRVLMPMINEAIFALSEGVADADSIDRMLTLGANHPMGPLALADLIGLDSCLAVLRSLHEGLGDPKYRPCPLLVKMVDAGRLGRRSGRGFYEYPAE